MNVHRQNRAAKLFGVILGAILTLVLSDPRALWTQVTGATLS
jgi:hypothetical protein